jgi:hypothetical protein
MDIAMTKSQCSQGWAQLFAESPTISWERLEWKPSAWQAKDQGGREETM